jgi:bifunctional ADP-heptose synthase (sugar kinase/adenylyltransferase)
MKKEILVIGDSCIDIFVHCKCVRICPEAPVPLLEIEDQIENGGMAMNVYNNILSLGTNCDIVTNNNWKNIKKIRYVDNHTNHMFIRIDQAELTNRIDLTTLDLNYNIIIISDYNKGFLTKEDIEWITQHHDCVFIDTKKHLGPWINLAKYIKINNIEYSFSKNVITEQLNTKIIQTQGKSGCTFNGKQYTVDPVSVVDVAGAGDTFLAGLTTKYLINNNNIDEAIIFANLCASRVVQERGVTTITI